MPSPSLPSEVFATDRVPATRRLDFWNQVAGDTFGSIAVEATTAEFGAHMRRQQFGALRLADVRSSPARVLGRPRSLSAPLPGWFLLLNEQGRSRLGQCGRQVALEPGQLTVLRADEDYRIEVAGHNRTLVLHLPDESGQIDFAAQIGRSHGADSAPLLVAFLRQLAQTNPAEGTASSIVNLPRLAVDLATLSWPAPACETRRASMLQWRQRAMAVVDRRLDDPTLDAAAVAAALQVSIRFVQMIFASAGYTLSQYLLEQRLKLASQRLREDPAARVTDIALGVGFDDISQFCRRFRQRFGVNASQYRSR